MSYLIFRQHFSLWQMRTFIQLVTQGRLWVLPGLLSQCHATYLLTSNSYVIRTQLVINTPAVCLPLQLHVFKPSHTNFPEDCLDFECFDSL